MGEKTAKESIKSPLRNETVYVRFIPRKNTRVPHSGHLLSGGMMDGATYTLCVPLLTNGVLKEVLTPDERKYFEHLFNLEDGDLSVYKKHGNYWDGSMDINYGDVVLTKQALKLDLSTPHDYIKYCVLRANTDVVALSREAYLKQPKATYRYYMTTEQAENSAAKNDMDTQRNCYKYYGKIEDDIDALRVVVERLTGRPISDNSKIETLQAKCYELINKDAKKFLAVASDELLEYKKIIRCNIGKNIIIRNGLYYLKDGNIPMALGNAEANLDNAAAFIAEASNQPILFSLQGVKNSK